MVIVCAVKCCSIEDNSEAKNAGVTFHKFPNDPDKRKSWLIAINRADLTNSPIAANLRVCSQHFLHTDFMDRGKLVLMFDAVPTEMVVSDKEILPESSELVVASVSSLAEGSSSQDQGGTPMLSDSENIPEPTVKGEVSVFAGENDDTAKEDTEKTDLEVSKLTVLEVVAGDGNSFNIQDLNKTIDDEDDDIILTSNQDGQELSDLGLSHEVDLDESDQDIVRQTLDEMVSKAVTTSTEKSKTYTKDSEAKGQSNAVNDALKTISLLQPIPQPFTSNSNHSNATFVPLEPSVKIPVGYLIEKVIRQSAHGSLTLNGVHENIISLDPVYARNSKWILWKLQRMLYGHSKRYGKLPNKSMDGKDLFALRKTIIKMKYQNLQMKTKQKFITKKQQEKDDSGPDETMDGRIKVRLTNDPNNPGKYKWLRRCIAYKCRNFVNPETEERGILFHRFPDAKRTPRLRKDWIAALHYKDYDPPPHTVICSDHFSEESYVYFRGDTAKALKTNAVPNIFQRKAVGSMMERRSGRRHGQLIKTESGKWIRLGGPGKVVLSNDLKRRHNIHDSFVKIPKLDTVNVRRMDGTAGIMLRNYPSAGFVERVQIGSKSPRVVAADADPPTQNKAGTYVEVSIPQQIQTEWQMFQSQYRYEQLQAKLKENRISDARKSCAVDHPYACPDAQELRSRLMNLIATEFKKKNNITQLKRENSELKRKIRKMTKQASRMASDQLQSIQHPVPIQKLANSRRITVLERQLMEEQQKRERESKRPIMVNRKQQYRMSDVIKDDPDFSEEEATEIITREIALERKIERKRKYARLYAERRTKQKEQKHQQQQKDTSTNTEATEGVKLETKVFVEETQLLGGEGTDTFMTETEEESEVEAPLRRAIMASNDPRPSTSGISTRSRARKAETGTKPPLKKRPRRGKNMPSLAVTTSLEEEEELKRMLSTANQELPTDLFQH